MMQFLIVLSVLFQVNTPTPVPNTAEDIINDIDGVSATAQALEANQGITTNGNQIYDANGNPLLPNSASPAMTMTISYAKFVMDSGSARAIFGPFAPIINHLKIFFTLTLAWFGGYFLMRLYSLAIRLIGWLIENWEIALIVAAIALVLAFLAWIEIRFEFFTTAIQWIMNKLQNIWDWMKGIF